VRRRDTVHAVEIDTSAGPARVELTMPPEGRAPAFLITLTHGSGGTPDTTDILAVARAARELGAASALVTQPYRVRGAQAPGNAVKQDAAWTELTAQLREQASSPSRFRCIPRVSPRSPVRTRSPPPVSACWS
jgi:hypothetical protein